VNFSLYHWNAQSATLAIIQNGEILLECNFTDSDGSDNEEGHNGKWKELTRERLVSSLGRPVKIDSWEA
jgi:hypothetical protein